MNVGTLTISLTARTASLAKAAAHVKAFEGGIISSAQRANAAISSIGMTFSALTIPIAAVGIGATKMFSAFEFTLAKVEGLIGIAHNQTMQWGADMLQLSKTIGVGANSMADSLYLVTTGGIRSAKTMEIVKKSAQASAAGMGQASTIAKVLTSAINAYGEANLGVGESMDILMTAVREGSVEASDLVVSLDKIFPISSAMKVEFEEVGAAVAALTRTGTPARTAGMMIRRMLLGIQKPAQGATKALEDMGSSFADLRNMVGNEKGGLLKALLHLKGLVEEFGEERLALVFPNLRSYLPALDILGENLEKNKVIWQEMLDTGGNFDDMLKVMHQTFQHKLNVALNASKQALTQLGHSIGKNLLPLIEKFTDKVNQLSDWWVNLSETTQNLIVKITLFVGVAGPLLILFSSIVNIVLSLVGALTAFVGAITAPISALFIFAAAVGLIVFNLEDWKRVLLDIDNIVFKKRFELMMENHQKLIESTTRQWKEYVREVTKGMDVKSKFRTFYLRQDISALQDELKDLEIVFEGTSDLDKREEVYQSMLRIVNDIYDKQKEIISLSDTNRFSKQGATGIIDTAKNSYLKLWSNKIDEPFVQSPVENVGAHLKTAILGSIDNIIKELGIKFPALEKEINKYREVLSDLFKEGDAAGSFPSTGPVDKLMTDLEYIEKMGMANLEFQPVQSLNIELPEFEINEFDRIADELVLNEYMVNVWADKIGKDFDRAGAMVKLYAKAISEMESTKLAGVDLSEENIEFIQNLYEKHNLLKESIADTEVRYKRLFSTLSRLAGSLSNLFMDLGTILGDAFAKSVKPIVNFIRLIESIFRVIDSVNKITEMFNTTMAVGTAVKQKDTVATVANATAKQLNAASSVANAVATTSETAADATNTGVKAANTAATEVNTASKIANAIGSAVSWLVATLGPFGMIAAAGVIGGIIAIATKGSKQAKSVAKMANGGIVPEGFPNDSYPALLTSGETVLPKPKALSAATNDNSVFTQSFDQSSREIRVVVEGKIRGKDIYYITKEIDRKTRNTY